MIVQGDAPCYGKEGIFAFVDLVDDEMVDAVVGPGCSYGE